MGDTFFSSFIGRERAGGCHDSENGKVPVLSGRRIKTYRVALVPLTKNRRGSLHSKYGGDRGRRGRRKVTITAGNTKMKKARDGLSPGWRPQRNIGTVLGKGTLPKTCDYDKKQCLTVQPQTGQALRSTAGRTWPRAVC